MNEARKAAVLLYWSRTGAYGGASCARYPCRKYSNSPQSRIPPERGTPVASRRIDVFQHPEYSDRIRGRKIGGIARFWGVAPESRYAIFKANSLLCKLELRFPSLWRFGFRPAWIEAEFNYKEELLTSVTYTLNTPAFTSSSGPVELAAVAFLGEDSNLEPHRSFNVFYRIWPSFMVPRAFRITFGVGLTPSATESERDAGFDFDLSCVSSFRGCSAFCQLMPSVWREGWRRYESKEMSLPKELLEDPNCYSAKNHLATSFWRSKQ